MKLESLLQQCEEFLGNMIPADAAHDISHVRRVVKNTSYLTDIEKANPLVTLPSAWLHDCVAVAKNSPLRSQGSRLAAEAAAEFLAQTAYPDELISEVFHAIEAHSYSANIATRSLEAAVVQDADRMDSLGAIGIARCLLVGGRLNLQMFSYDDPFCEEREPDDSKYTIDHFYAKLFTLPNTMKTETGRLEAQRRATLMQRYLDDLKAEM